MSTTGRGIGWSFEDKHCTHPVDPRHRTRATFIASRLHRIFALCILWDATVAFNHCSPAFLSGIPVSIIEQGYFLRGTNGLFFFLSGYASIAICYNTLAVVAVATNLHQPTLWPPPFGHLKDAYTIRNFWGRVWHQFMRYRLTVFGPHLCGKHRMRDSTSSTGSSVQNGSESWVRSYCRICNAFICSAVLHMCGDAILQIKIWKNGIANPLSSIPVVIGFSAPFFLLQPVGILIEDGGMVLGRRLGLKASTWTKVVGYVWVLTWMTITLPHFLNDMKAASRVAYPSLYERNRASIDTSVIGKFARRCCGIDLESFLSSWLAGQ
ncbi:hypothetical protein ID866_10164 [Astraeus odoratus]|nr:hypothetical protein ID866_10164 [Astraeus odoratus]